LKLAATIYGDDFNERRRVGSDVAKALRATPGTIEVLVDDRLPLPDWNRRWSRKPAL
jgi:Cu/Ag efflux pump CusA